MNIDIIKEYNLAEVVKKYPKLKELLHKTTVEEIEKNVKEKK